MGSTSGYSQQDPNDSASDWRSRQFQIERTLARVRTVVLAVVKSVSPGNGSPPGQGTVSVQPLVKIIDGQGNVSSHGAINNVPVFRIGGGGNAVICDPATGDIGWLAVADRDISTVKNTKAESPPGSRRKFDLADAVYLGSLFKGTPTQFVYFSENGVQIQSGSGGINLNGLVINQSGQVAGNLPVTGALELGGTLEALAGGTYSGNIHTSGTVTGDTDVIAAGKSGKSHIHSGVTTGSGDSGPPV